MKLIKAIRGTKDIYGTEAEKFMYVSRIAEEIFENYGYTFIKTPIFEDTDLFKRGIGEGTDVVEKEMYTFVDKGDRSITLRPENTASVVRAYLENAMYSQEEVSKFYYNGSMFRYERPQAGRQREFNQIGVEVLGESSPVLDAEVITMSYEFLGKLGLKDLDIRINSVGGSETRQRYRQVLLDYLAPIKDQLCEDCQTRMEKNPLRVLDCKNETCKKLTSSAPTIISSLSSEEKKHYDQVKKYLDIFGVKYTEDPTLVRGLDYYSSTVYEIVTNKLGAQGTVLGGGRYDNLIKQLGDRDIPAFGFAAGVERMMMLLENFQKSAPDVYIAWIGESLREEALQMAQTLRNIGLKTYIEYDSRNMKAHMKKADKLAVKYCLIVGEEEFEKNKVILKNFETREQQELPFNVAIDYIRKKLR